METSGDFRARSTRLCVAIGLAAVLVGVAGCGSDTSANPTSTVASTIASTVAPTAATIATAAAFPDGVYRATIENAPYAAAKDLVTTLTFVGGVWTNHDDSGEDDCGGTYASDAARIQITTSTEKARDCGNVPGEVFFDAAWTVDGSGLHFTDIKSDSNAVYAFGHQSWTKVG
jgi:hypothetical protein